MVHSEMLKSNPQELGFSITVFSMPTWCRVSTLLLMSPCSRVSPRARACQHAPHVSTLCVYQHARACQHGPNKHVSTPRRVSMLSAMLTRRHASPCQHSAAILTRRACLSAWLGHVSTAERLNTPSRLGRGGMAMGAHVSTAVTMLTCHPCQHSQGHATTARINTPKAYQHGKVCQHTCSKVVHMAKSM